MRIISIGFNAKLLASGLYNLYYLLSLAFVRLFSSDGKNKTITEQKGMKKKNKIKGMKGMKVTKAKI